MIEEALKAMSAADAPPAHDPAFEIAVLARIERRRFHRALLRNAAVTLASAMVLVLTMPQLAPLWQAGVAAGSRMLPSDLPPHLVPGLFLTAAFLALPWWRGALFTHS